MFKGSWWKNRNSKRFGRAQAQPQAQQGAGGRESLIRGLPPVATEGHPIIPSYPTCFGAGGGWVILSLPIGPGVGTSGQFGQDRLIPCGWQALVFPASLGTDYLRPACPQGTQARVFSPVCEESAFGSNSCPDPVTHAAVQLGGLVGRGLRDLYLDPHE